MSKVRLWVVMSITTVLIACNFTEEIYLEDNGSGKISIAFDGSELMQMAGSEMGGMPEEKAIDSVMHFKDFLAQHKDSIAQLSAEEQAKLKRLEPFSLHMVMNQESQEMKFDLYSEFKDLSEVTDVFSAFNEASTLGPKAQGSMSATPSTSESTQVDYSFTDRTFKRKVIILDETLHQQSIDSLQSMEMFLSNSTYTLKYHFPKKVKKASAENATYSADGKTLIYSVNFIEYMKNPQLLDLEVELEK